MNVIGIDPSLTATAVFVLDETCYSPARKVIKTIPHAGVAGRVLRCSKAAKEVRQMMDEWKPVLVCIEGYSFGSNTAKHAEIIEHGYELRRMLCGLDCTPRVIEVAPMSLKKHATGTGKGDKTAVVARMAKRFPEIEFSMNDESDAAALALIALQCAGLAEPENQAQRDVIDVLLNGRAKKPKRKKLPATVGEIQDGA